ncbi:MAG: ABC transporter permease, partial [Oscillospiraceae bacterium]
MDKFRKIASSILNLLLPIVFAFSVGAIFIAINGKNPLYIYKFLISQSLLNTTGILNTLAYATPIIMTGLGIAISFKSGLFNMGIEGQMYMGAFFATYLGFTLQGLPSILHISICILGGAIMGMLFAIIPAVLKAYFHVNEMVVTMMLNYAAIIFTKYLTNGPFTANIGYPATQAVSDSAKLTRLSSKSALTPAIFIAIALVLLVFIIYKKTKLGYEIEALGKHVEFADSVGMRVDKKIIVIFLIAGAISGIAGATEMLGVHYRFTPGFSTNPGLGWDGM